jgi:hypothetical protein
MPAALASTRLPRRMHPDLYPREARVLDRHPATSVYVRAVLVWPGCGMKTRKWAANPHGRRPAASFAVSVDLGRLDSAQVARFALEHSNPHGRVPR